MQILRIPARSLDIESHLTDDRVSKKGQHCCTALFCLRLYITYYSTLSLLVCPTEPVGCGIDESPSASTVTTFSAATGLAIYAGLIRVSGFIAISIVSCHCEVVGLTVFKVCDCDTIPVPNVQCHIVISTGSALVDVIARNIPRTGFPF